jgi:hypothetical protein
VALAVALASVLFAPSVVPPGYDREFFRYIGMIVFKGWMPYVDAFDHHPPLIFLLSALGHPLGPWGLWLLETLFVAGTAVLLTSLALRRGWSPWWISPAVFIFLSRLPNLVEGGGLTRSFAAPVLGAGICAAEGDSPRREIWVGAAVGALLMLQQEVLLPFLPWVAVLIWRSASKGKTTRRMLAGLACVVAPLALWLGARGALRAFFEQAWLFNFAYAGLRSLTWTERVWQLVSALREFHLIWIIGALGAGALITGRGGILLAAVGLQMAAASISGRFYGHYFLPFCPLLALLAGALSGSPRGALRRRVALGIAVVALVPAGRYYAGFIRNSTAASHEGYAARFERLRSAVDPLRGRDGKFYVAGGSTSATAVSVNTDLEIVAPTKWVYTHFWRRDPSFDPDGALFDALLRDLDAAQTEVILDASERYPFRFGVQGKWREFLARNYEPSPGRFSDPDTGTLWIRRKSRS